MRAASGAKWGGRCGTDDLISVTSPSARPQACEPRALGQCQPWCLSAAAARGSRRGREGGGQGRVMLLVQASLLQASTWPLLRRGLKHDPGRSVQSTWWPRNGGHAGDHPQLIRCSQAGLCTCLPHQRTKDNEKGIWILQQWPQPQRGPGLPTKDSEPPRQCSPQTRAPTEPPAPRPAPPQCGQPEPLLPRAAAEPRPPGLFRLPAHLLGFLPPAPGPCRPARRGF